MWKRTFQLTSVLALEVWPGLWSEASIRTWMLLHSSFKHWSTLCLIHPVYSLRDSCGESNYFELSSTLLLVTLRLLFISLAFPRSRGFQSAQWVACTNILPLYVGNRWVNTAESLKHFPLLLLDYQLPFRASYAQMSAKINGALSAALIRSGLALPLLIRDFFFNLKQKRNQVEPMSDSPIFSAPPTPIDINQEAFHIHYWIVGLACWERGVEMEAVNCCVKRSGRFSLSVAGILPFLQQSNWDHK